MQYSAKKILSGILKDDPAGVILCRSDDEISYLREFISGMKTADRQTPYPAAPGAMISGCMKCGAGVERKNAYGTGANGVMIILNAPRMANRVELRIHRSESVELLRKMVNAIGLELHECYVTNVIKCDTSDPLLKPSDMLRNCLDILKAEIEMVNPRIGLVMGEIVPVQPVINSSRGISWFNTEHAVSLIKNPELKRTAWETLKVIRKRYSEIRDAG